MKPDRSARHGLPVMDGYDLALRMHAQQPGSDSFSISGYEQDSDLKRPDACFPQRLTKPVDLETLAHLLEDRRSQRATTS